MASRGTRSKADTNAAILKKLLKQPENKYCCDCKTADHPRWASWNLGIFLCIRCSGIHRSMGTHISRVKSVDLDAWTDEQTQSMIRWGNHKANKYWEAKLAREHVPADGKVDNFVKTKYVSRRWVSAPERPDPEDLSADESAPSPGSQTIATTEATHRTTGARTDSHQKHAAPLQPTSSLLDFDATPVPSVPSQANAKPAVQPAPAILTRDPVPAMRKTNVSLLSGAVQEAPSQQTSRNDLKMSIMSLYASAPKNQGSTRQQEAFSPQPRHDPISSPQSSTSNSKGHGAFDDLSGLFGNVSFAPPASGGAAGIQAQNLTASSAVPANQNSWQPSLTSTSDGWPSQAESGSSTGGAFTGPAPTQKSAFDDLYSTSDVWK